MRDDERSSGKIWPFLNYSSDSDPNSDLCAVRNPNKLDAQALMALPPFAAALIIVLEVVDPVARKPRPARHGAVAAVSAGGPWSRAPPGRGMELRRRMGPAVCALWRVALGLLGRRQEGGPRPRPRPRPCRPPASPTPTPSAASSASWTAGSRRASCWAAP